MPAPRRSLPNTIGRAALGASLLAAALPTVGCATDTIEDRRYGQQVVCHDGKTITVSNADSFVHLDHGDTLGPCPAG
ncbi:MAG: hypothetical protein R3233_04600 [Xanthomonadales bacterium]|nr:hypothetical protein [Xanthomonadales bacterium]